MIHEPTEAEIIDLIRRREAIKAMTKKDWITQTCLKQITEMEASIVKLRKLIDLCKNPEVVNGIELFVGKK